VGFIHGETFQPLMPKIYFSVNSREFEVTNPSKTNSNIELGKFTFGLTIKIYSSNLQFKIVGYSEMGRVCSHIIKNGNEETPKTTTTVLAHHLNPFKEQWLLYVPFVVGSKTCILMSVFMFFLQFLEQTVTISINDINWLDFIMET
jgi:hypothetical protein